MNNKFSTKQHGSRFKILRQKSLILATSCVFSSSFFFLSCWYNNFNHKRHFGNFPFSLLENVFNYEWALNFLLLLSASFCFHFGNKKLKTFFCSSKKLKTFFCSNKKKFLIFFWHFFVQPVFVEMKRLKSFFLSNVVALVVIN